MMHYPVDTGNKLNNHKSFRRYCGHFVNVLYAFSLRPVSTEYLWYRITCMSPKTNILNMELTSSVQKLFVLILKKQCLVKLYCIRKNFDQ